MQRILFFIILASIFFTSCDDEPVLSQATIFKDGKKAILITQESIVTITSKKSGQGMTQRSGYTTCYLNAIDVNTGESIKRKKIGDFKDRVEIIGQCGGKLWCFSYDPDVSIHARDPETLEVLVSGMDIIAKNTVLNAGFTEQGHQFNLDSSSTKVFVTTKDGYSFLIDPSTLAATKATERSNRRYFGSMDATETSRLILNDSVELSWKQDTRKVLSVHRETFDQKSFDFFSQNNSKPHKNLYYKTLSRKEYPELSFIEPAFILDKLAPKTEHNEDAALMKDNSIFVLSKSILGNTFNWIVSAIHLSEVDTKLVWQKEIGETEKIKYNDKDLLDVGVVEDKVVFVFENMMVVFNVKSGEVVWRKDITK